MIRYIFLINHKMLLVILLCKCCCPIYICLDKCNSIYICLDECTEVTFAQTYVTHFTYVRTYVKAHVHKKFSFINIFRYVFYL